MAVRNMKKVVKSWALKSGMAAVLIYLLHVILGGLLWKEYSHLHEPISTLTASGAPNRSMLLLLTNLYGITALVFAVSFVIFESRKYNTLVRVGGISLILLHILSISYGFFPQDLPGVELSFKGRMHLLVTIFIVPVTILTPFLIGFGLKNIKGWNTFGRFSLICGILILVFGGLTGFFFAKQLPYFGLVERLNIGTLQIWTFIFSYKLVKSNDDKG
jgi:hypothetical protein